MHTLLRRQELIVCELMNTSAVWFPLHVDVLITLNIPEGVRISYSAWPVLRASLLLPSL